MGKNTWRCLQVFRCGGCNQHFESKKGCRLHQLNSDGCSTDDKIEGEAEPEDLWEKMGADYAEKSASSVYQHHQALK